MTVSGMRLTEPIHADCSFSFSMPKAPLTFLFKDDGMVPNNPALPVLVYKGAAAIEDKRSPEGAIENQFATNGWGHGQWRNGIYPFVHYHSMIHEALGIARGRARVQLGGTGCEVFELAAGSPGPFDRNTPSGLSAMMSSAEVFAGTTVILQPEPASSRRMLRLMP